VTNHSDSGAVFKSRKFTDFATVKEALISKEIGASFILAPLAMQLVRDGVPIKIVYLGHRDGSALVVAKDGPVKHFRDLAGRIIAVPNRYSNQHILVRKLMRDNGMAPGSIDVRELPPPEHPPALASNSIDAFLVGEPFPAKAELDGIGRVLHLTKDIWPDFISCVLVVRNDLIESDRELIQELVSGIARSGLWLEEGLEHRMEAAQVVGKHFYFQPPKLLEYVLSKPIDRVRYSDLAPLREDFDEIMELAVSSGVLSGRIEFEEYVDPSFSMRAHQAWDLAHLPALDAEAPVAPPAPQPAPQPAPGSAPAGDGQAPKPAGPPGKPLNPLLLPAAQDSAQEGGSQ
jgi:NitT/TauT family transport system substrate-binding protein